MTKGKKKKYRESGRQPDSKKKRGKEKEEKLRVDHGIHI